MISQNNYLKKLRDERTLRATKRAPKIDFFSLELTEIEVPSPDSAISSKSYPSALHMDKIL